MVEPISVKVYWWDAHSESLWSQTPLHRAVCISVGYIVANNEKELVITSTISAGSWLGQVAIPQGCIDKIVTIEI